MVSKVIYSSKTDEYETPKDLYAELHKEFRFNLDPCANWKNAKCAKYFTKKEDSLKKSWKGRRVFCNPPYSKVAQWVEKAATENALTVMLLPARTDTRWFHDWCYPYTRLRFIKGRLKFGTMKNSAPFPSMIVIFDNL